MTAPRAPARPGRRTRSTRCRPARSAPRPRSCAASGASDERWRFASIELQEPSKEAVRAFAPGDPIAREAEVICWNREDAQAYKARVSLGSEDAWCTGSTAPASSRT